jgi:hypothetical protein
MLRAAYLALFLGLAITYYEFLGAEPTPSERAGSIAWWRPAGWARSLEWNALKTLQEIGADTVQARHEGRFEPRSLIPLGLFAAPAALASAVGFALFRSSLMRAALLALGLTLCAFSYYGWLDLETWQDYGWRWPLVLLSTAGYLAVFALAPAFVRAVRSRSRAFQGAALLAFVVPIHVLSLEVTGTNPELAWNLSPWPTLTLFGFLLFGLVIGVVHVAAGLGLALRARLPGAAGAALGPLVAATAALALRAIPFERTSAVRAAALAIPAALLAALAGRRRGRQEAAAAFLVAGLLVVGSIKLGQWHAERFLARARDEVAPRVIDALERYHATHTAYPAELGDLVPGEIPAIPRPRIGWLSDEDERFTYTDLGDSFLLEFPGPVWVQCAYSPPYAEEGEETEDAGGASEPAAEGLAAAWSCESKPPRLW